jgi:hypothetical protein
MLTIFLLLLVLPAAAVEFSFSLKGNGSMFFITEQAATSSLQTHRIGHRDPS